MGVVTVMCTCFAKTKTRAYTFSNIFLLTPACSGFWKFWLWLWAYDFLFLGSYESLKAYDLYVTRGA